MKLTPKLLAFFLILLCREARAQDYKTWEPNKKEKLGKTIALSVPRALDRISKVFYQGSTAKKVENTFCSPMRIIQNKEGALVDLSNSAINPLSTLNSLVSDVGSILKAAVNVKGRSSKRLRLCHQNFAEPYLQIYSDPKLASFICPAFHVGIILDGYQEYGDGNYIGKGLKANNSSSCQTVEIASGESENVALERLHCTHQKFNYEYSFLTYNCGGIAKDLLNITGFTYPALYNAGIGADLPIGSSERKTSRERLKSIAEDCDEHVNQLWKFIRQLEKGEELSSQLRSSMINAYENSLVSHNASFAILITLIKTQKSQESEFAPLLGHAISGSKALLSGLSAAKKKVFVRRAMREIRRMYRGTSSAERKLLLEFLGAQEMVIIE